VFDTRLRKAIDPALNDFARRLVDAGISANAMTGLGVLLAMVAAVAIYSSSFGFALFFIAANRLCDGLDGAVARIKGVTPWGGYIDSLADYVFYLAVPLAFGLADAHNGAAAMLLIASFTLTAVSFLALAAILANQGQGEANAHGPKAFIYSTGIAEGGETIASFILMCLFPNNFAMIAYGFAVLCLMTVVQRAILAQQML
jgi:phosphatidylglycerophosphate synthase